MSKVRVIAPYVGGSFGGKTDVNHEAAVAMLALKSGRPVQLVLSRQEEFIATAPKHPTVTKLKTAVSADGRLLGIEARVLFDTGAYASHGPLTAGRVMLVAGPYRVPALKLDGLAVYTNKVSCGAVRGPGAFQLAFAIESQMDVIAHELGIEPLELRRRSALGPGDTTATGVKIDCASFPATMDAVEQRIKETPASPPPTSLPPYLRSGRGWACSMWGSGTQAASAMIKLNEDGSLSLSYGSPEVGNGSSTVLSQIVAEELQVPLGQITLSCADTELTPYDLASGSSRITYTLGLTLDSYSLAGHCFTVTRSSDSGSPTCRTGRHGAGRFRSTGLLRRNCTSGPRQLWRADCRGAAVHPAYA
jgi:carbon-monoxide dehydrogenase large subunit